jgi:hypothetical protein
MIGDCTVASDHVRERLVAEFLSERERDDQTDNDKATRVITDDDF